MQFVQNFPFMTILLTLICAVITSVLDGRKARRRYHLKRSYIRKDIEYIYMFHYPLSTHMVLNTGALDHYDTVFCVGEFQFAEIRKAEEIYGLPEKKLISAGYGQLEQLYAGYQAMEKTQRSRPKILIAPSWQEAVLIDNFCHRGRFSLTTLVLGNGLCAKK